MKSIKIEGPRRFHGELAPPGDKSITHRALMLAAGAKGESTITRPLMGLDCRATASAVEALGAKIKRGPKQWKVMGVGGPKPAGFHEPGKVIDCGNSGTSIRLLAGLVAAYPITVFFTGDESIRRRPMGRVLDPLESMGATVLGSHGNTQAPFGIRGGKLVAKTHELKVASAQAKSAILLAALGAEGKTVVNEPSASRDHTERMLLHFGAPLSSTPRSVSVKGPLTLEAAEIYVPGDISSAAFFLVGATGAPKSTLRMQEVGVNPTRTGVLAVLARMGAKIQREGEREASGEPIADLIAATAGALAGTGIGGAEIPTLIDEIPVLALAAARASGETRISGAAELKVKESDRIAGTAEVLRAFGVAVEETADGLVIQGGASFRPAKVASRGDHRLAMTAAIAACFASGESTIDDVGCVETSYPGFFEDLLAVTEKA